MGIRREQPGAAKAAAVAGTAIGAGQKAVRQQAEAAAIQRQQMQIKAREAAEQRAMQWEQQKMEVNSQRAFERELRQEDYKLAAEDRAAEGIINRMEYAKDLKFQAEIQERQRKKGVIQTERDAWIKEEKEGRVTKKETAAKLSELDDRDRAIDMDETYRPQKPRSAVSQVSEIDATLELESYTQQDLIEAGLDPTDFPGIAANEDVVEVAVREQVTQVEEQGGQVYFNKQTGERIVSYDGGDTWESLGGTQEEIPEEVSQDKESFLKSFLSRTPIGTGPIAFRGSR